MTRTITWLLFAAGIALTARAADPSALWHIVHDRCVPDAQMHQNPAPCAAVNLAGGFVVLKDITGNTQYLVIPTTRVSGIEDKAILAPGAPNYFADAWDARSYVDRSAGHDLPRDDITLAINSIYGRTQDQLHIHVDCIRRDVRDSLEQYQSQIGTRWGAFPVPLAGHKYRAMRIVQPEPGSINPFRLLAEDVTQAQMGTHTLVLAGATFDGKPGFILLDGEAALATGDRGSGEELQDHDCGLAR